MIKGRWTLALVLALASSCALAADPNEFLVWNYTNGSSTMPGRLYVPSDYNASQAYPIIVFFHGLGEGGTNNTAQVNNNINNLLAACKARKAFLYAPQSFSGWWGDEMTVQAMAKVTQTFGAYNIDQERVYVTGLSAGGGGVFSAMETHSNMIAAGVAICAASGGWRSRSNILAGKPFWLYHAANDGTVGVDQSRNALNGIRAAEGKTTISFPLDANPSNPYYNTGSPFYTDGSTYYQEGMLRYTEYDTGNHGIWGRVYNEQWMYDWLFATVRGDAVNTPPLVRAGNDIDCAPPDNMVHLIGSAVDDGRPITPGRITTMWTKASGPADVVFGDATAPTTTATFSEPGHYVLRLTANDGEHEAFDDVAVRYYVGPSIRYQSTDLGDGLTGWTFRIVNDDALTVSYTVALGFQGTDGAVIRQTKSSAVHVNKEGWKEWEPEVEEWNGEGAILCDEVDPAYDMALDTWAFNPFGDNASPGTNPLTGANLTGFYNAANAFALSCFSGTGSTLGNNVNVAYVVANGNVSWTGKILRSGREYVTAGVTELPSLLGDFNGDGSVTHGDYTVWADHYGQSIASVRADHPGWFPVGSYPDGATTLTQGLYTTWADHFGNTLNPPMTVGQSAMPAVADDSGAADESISPAAARRAARMVQRQQRRAARAAGRQQRAAK